MGSNTIYQWIQEESCPLCIRCLVLGVDSAVTQELTPAPPWPWSVAPGEHCLRQSLIGKSLCGSPGFQCGSSSILLKQEIWIWMHWRQWEEWFDLPASPFLQGGTSQDQDIFSACDFFCRGKWECWVSTWLPQLYRMLPRGPVYRSPYPEYWIMNCMTGEPGRGWEIGR